MGSLVLGPVGALLVIQYGPKALFSACLYHRSPMPPGHCPLANTACHPPLPATHHHANHPPALASHAPLQPGYHGQVGFTVASLVSRQLARILR